MEMKALLTITDAAAEHIKALVSAGPEGALGLKIGVQSKGCSGLSYAMDYAMGDEKSFEKIERNGAQIFVDPAAILFLAGTEIDFVKDDYREGFTFNNPNEKSRCGCGESFNA